MTTTNLKIGAVTKKLIWSHGKSKTTFLLIYSNNLFRIIPKYSKSIVYILQSNVYTKYSYSKKIVKKIGILIPINWNIPKIRFQLREYFE